MTMATGHRWVTLENACDQYHDEIDQVLTPITEALNEQTGHLAQAWGEAVFHVADAIASKGWHIKFADDAQAPGALAWHDVDLAGRPFGLIGVGTILTIAGASLTDGALSVSAATSHEVCETIIDPGCSTFEDGFNGVYFAREACDAVQNDAYEAANGVALSDFLRPAFFSAFAPLDGSTGFDYMSVVHYPFETRPGGYQVISDGGTVSQVFGYDVDPAVQAWKETSRRARWRGVNTSAPTNVA